MVFISKCHTVQGTAVLEKQGGDRNVSREEPLQQNVALLRIWIYNSLKVLRILFKVNHTGLSTLRYRTPGWFQSFSLKKKKKEKSTKNPPQNLKPYPPKNIYF